MWFKNASAVIVAFLVGFVFMNVALYAVSVVRASLGGINPVAEKYGVSPLSLYPGFTRAQYAELMKETWSRGFLYEPFTTIKEGPYHGTYVNVDESGFRHVKNQESWPLKKANFNIFIFGNSAVFNYGVPDEQTIASYLQEFLQTGSGKNVAVYNFGRGFFYSSQERALYDKLLVSGNIPNVAVFIGGQTEFDVGTLGERPQFTQDIESFFSGNTYSRILSSLPVVSWIKSFLATKNTWSTSTISYVPTEKDTTNINEAIQRFIANKKLIEATSLAFGVQVFFVWQPIPSYEYNPDLDLFKKASIGPDASLGYPYMAKYVADHSMGNNFLYLADIQKGVKEPLYIDGLHYSGAWSREIALRIANFLKTKIF
ncbi:MAG: hypothetical protein AAB738_00515 [Patescibacteria group bacterium]